MIVKKNTTFFIIIFISFLLHIIFINFYPVNFEFAFFEASDFIIKGFDKSISRRFFEIQANSFFFSFIISFISFIFPFFKPIYIGKLLSASSMVFIGLGVLNLKHSKIIIYKILNENLLLIFILLNPLIWVFSYRSTPDVFSTALAFYGFTLILKYLKNSKKIYLGFFLIGFATAMKVITGIYFIASILIFNIKNIKNNLSKFILICFFFSIIPAIYYSLIYLNFNFFLFSPYYKNVLSNVSSPAIYLNNVILYTSFLFIFLSPIFIIKIINIIISSNLRFFIINLILFAILFISGIFLLKTSLEMNFGYFSSLLNIKILNGFLVCFSYIFFGIILFEVKNKFKGKKFIEFFLILLIIFYILIISFTLPSQRYLITIIPLSIILLLIDVDYFKKKYIFFLLMICLPVNFVLIVNQYLTGSAAREIVNFVNKNNLINEVCFGSIGSHSMHEFPYEIRDPLKCSKKNIHVNVGEYVYGEYKIFSASKNFLIFNKTYKLSKVR